MPILHAIILAIVQGLTEFLPISSTAHLVLISYFAGWPEQGLAFDVALHVGTLAAVLLYFIRDWFELTLAGFGIRPSAAMRDEEFFWKRGLFWLLVVGTIPGAIAGVLLEKTVENTLSKPIPIACAMILVGLLMWWVDRLTNLERRMKDLTLTDAIVVGTAQAFALIPGVSRSGSTIMAGLWRRLTRESAARFSFLLSTPLIAGAALKEVPKLLHERHAGGLDLPMSTLLVAVAVSALVGYAVIAFFLRYLQTRTLKVFVVYRIALGILILLFVLLHLGSTR